MINTAIAVIVLLILFVGSVWLQIYLSKSKNKWLGLIIPFICFVFSIFIIISFSMYSNMRTISMTNTIHGVAVINKTVSSQSEKTSMISMLASVIPVFLISNIPTLIFLAIYFACREKLKLRKELDKMNVQDLE